jgi:hypothetical protein
MMQFMATMATMSIQKKIADEMEESGSVRKRNKRRFQLLALPDSHGPGNRVNSVDRKNHLKLCGSDVCRRRRCSPSVSSSIEADTERREVRSFAFLPVAVIVSIMLRRPLLLRLLNRIHR